MATVRKLSPFRLTSLLRQEKDPLLALQLFLNPRPKRPFPYSSQSYDVIICKLGRAKMFEEMEQILQQMMHQETNSNRFTPKEALFCHVISFYGRARLPNLAVQTYGRIPSFRCTRTIKSFNTLLNALVICRDFSRVKKCCSDLDLEPDACTYNILIRVCLSIGSLDSASKLFDEMCRRGIAPNVYTFGTLISGLCSNLKIEDAFKLKDEMLGVYNVRPNVVVYTSLIKGLCEVGDLDAALKLEEELLLLKKELDLDCAIYSTLIRALFRSGRKDEVVSLLEKMRKSGLKPDAVTYNAMIAGFCENKDFDAALEVLNEMVKQGCKPDVLSYNVIVAGLLKDGKWAQARCLFEDMPRRGCLPDVISYRILVDGLCDGMQFEDITGLLDEMTIKGYKLHSASTTRIVKRLEEEGEVDLLLSVLKIIMTKDNAISSRVWDVATRMVCRDCEMGRRIFQLVDGLTLTSSSASSSSSLISKFS